MQTLTNSITKYYESKQNIQVSFSLQVIPQCCHSKLWLNYAVNRMAVTVTMNLTTSFGSHKLGYIQWVRYFQNLSIFYINNRYLDVHRNSIVITTFGSHLMLKRIQMDIHITWANMSCVPEISGATNHWPVNSVPPLRRWFISNTARKTLNPNLTHSALKISRVESPPSLPQRLQLYY